MKDDKYNGWTNYATWRVQLELISDYVNGMFEAQAIEQYANYLSAVAGSLFGDNNLIKAKTFKEWLATEV